jgi:hypothetical protein
MEKESESWTFSKSPKLLKKFIQKNPPLRGQNFSAALDRFQKQDSDYPPQKRDL